MIDRLNAAVFDDAFQRRTVTSEDGCEIACWSNGRTEAPALVLIHGFALDHTVWAPVCARPELSVHCHLVVPDLRGHGLSGHPPEAAGYARGEAWAADLEALIRGLRLHAPTVVAWSFGGRSVLDYVRRFGTGALHGIVFVAAAAQAHYASVGPDHEVLAQLCSAVPDEVAQATGRFLTEVLRVEPGSEAAAALLAAAQRSSARERGWMRTRPLDYDDLIATLDLPVMWINGSDDGIVLPTRAQAFKDVLPAARLARYAGCGHAPFMEAPARFATDLRAFVDDPPPCPRHRTPA